MINSVWQTLVLSRAPLYQWLNASYLHHWVGFLQTWRKGSWFIQWADLIGGILISLVFGLTPFVSNDLVKVLLLACAGFWLLLTVSDSPTRNTSIPSENQNSFTPIHLVVLLYWGISLVATALSPVKAAALDGFLKLTSYLLLFVLMSRLLRSSRVRTWLITLYLHVALIVSAYGIRQWIDKVEPLATWNDPTSAGANATRVYSYLGNPNLLGGYLLAAIAFSFAALFAWRGWGPKALALTMLVTNVACLRYTESRGAWIGFVALITVFLVLLWLWLRFWLPPFWRNWSLPLALGSMFGVLLLAILFVEPLRNRVSSILVGRRDSSSNYRLNVWISVIEMIKDHPILGIGPGNRAFNKIYPLYQSPRYSALSAYSIALEVLVETGLIGFTCFLWLLLVIFNQGFVQLERLRRMESREGFWMMGAIASLTGMLAHGLFDTVWYRPEISTLWWMVVALIASFYTYQPQNQQPQNQGASSTP